MPPWFQQLLLLLYVASLAYSGGYCLRAAWLGWLLRRRGIRVTGELTRRRAFRGVTHWARFQTLAGQVVEGKSHGLAWRDPWHAVGEEVTVYYEAAHPACFMLESELDKPSLYQQLIMALILMLVTLASLSDATASLAELLGHLAD